MDGVHDMGGMDGYGPLKFEEDEPNFAAEWEGRVIGMFASCFVGGYFYTDIFRHCVERCMTNDVHLNTSYYEKWYNSLCTVMQEKGAITQEELDAKYEEIKKELG